MITHPEKVLFPDCGITKGEMAAYYEEVAPIMVPHVVGRPVTMERYPEGIDKKGFIQKDVTKGAPDWLERVELPKKEGGSVHYPLVRDARSLSWLANQNSVTPHVWTSRAPTLDRPDLCVFNLNPSRDAPESLWRAALAVREVLDELGLPSFVKTSGSKGFHIVVPLDDTADFDTVWRFGHGTGAVLVKRHANLFTQEFIKADRAGRIFVDTGRNGHGATFAAVYAVRPKPGAPVSAPCEWEELERGHVGPQSFTLRTMARRIAQVGDLWAKIEDQQHSLDGALAALDRLLTKDDWSEAVAATTRRPKSRQGRRVSSSKSGSAKPTE